jgi:glyoxalase-like protein
MGKTQIVVVAAACGLLAETGMAQTKTATNLLTTVDHLVYATPDLQASIDALEKRLGVRAAPGGQHPGRGTRNALIALSPTSYIEIIGPDPEQPKPELPRQFGIDTLAEARLVTWAAKSNDLERTVTQAAGHAVKLGEVLPGSRRRPDGLLLNWRYTNPRVVVADGIVPFFIDWGSTPHPAQTAASGASLLDLVAEHPDAERVQQLLTGLGLGLMVKKGPSPALTAIISSPRGRIELR